MPYPVDLKYIVETEQELGLIFPDSFKVKMSPENGGELMTEDDDWQEFLFFDKGQLVVLANCFQKKTQKIPKNEIELALKIEVEYENKK